jgi:hypothetical protein
MSASLGYNTNNKYPEFPPLMSDGRVVTASYQPESIINNDIINKNNIKSNWEYRQYLINNGSQLMEQHFKDSCNDSGCVASIYEIHNSANIIKDPVKNPFVYNGDNLNDKPFGHSTSDLKTSYLSREDLTAQKDVPHKM